MNAKKIKFPSLPPEFDTVTWEAQKNLSADFASKLNRLILEVLQPHLPGITEQNATDYAHRVSIAHQEGTPYPEYVWVDHGTPEQVLVLSLNEPVLSFEGGTATFTQSYTR